LKGRYQKKQGDKMFALVVFGVLIAFWEGFLFLADKPNKSGYSRINANQTAWMMVVLVVGTVLILLAK